jgi:hypothetical protein
MDGGLHKAYLVSLMDDASRLIAHSAFAPGEKALDIEAGLKQAVLKRGLPVKLVVDNGPAYRSKTLQGICARLGIHLVYCRPYTPEGYVLPENMLRRCGKSTRRMGNGSQMRNIKNCLIVVCLHPQSRSYHVRHAIHPPIRPGPPP